MLSIERQRTAAASVFVLSVALAGTAEAQITELADPASFSGSEQIIDFEGLGTQGDLISNVGGVAFVLSPSAIAPRLSTNDTGPREFPPGGTSPTENGALDPFSAPNTSPYDDLEITFPTEINRLGFEFSTASGNTVNVSLSSGGAPVTSFNFSAPATGAFKFFAFESVQSFDEAVVQVQVTGTNSSFWRLDNLRFEASTATTYSCVGFDPPAHAGPIKVKKNRVIPFKAQLQREDTTFVTDADVVAAPAIQVIYSPADGGDAVDVTEDSLPAGQGTDGNQFEFSGDRWRYNLKTKNYSAAGTYTVQLISGDNDEYLVDPSCSADFVID